MKITLFNTFLILQTQLSSHILTTDTCILEKGSSLLNMDFAIKSLLPRAGGSSSSTNVVDQDPGKMVEEFAKMLVAQITNQDPDNPVSPSELIAQNAQFTASLATVRLANQMAHYEQIGSVMSSIGKTIEFLDTTTGAATVGSVIGADFVTSPPSLLVTLPNGSGKRVSMDNVLRLDGAPAATSTDPQQLAQLTKSNLLQMLGKTVEYFDPDDNTNQVGVIDDVDLLSPTGIVSINGKSVPAEDVIRIVN